jgi:hypothetical protein
MRWRFAPPSPTSGEPGRSNRLPRRCSGPRTRAERGHRDSGPLDKRSADRIHIRFRQRLKQVRRQRPAHSEDGDGAPQDRAIGLRGAQTPGGSGPFSPTAVVKPFRARSLPPTKHYLIAAAMPAIHSPIFAGFRRAISRSTATRAGLRRSCGRRRNSFLRLWVAGRASC